MWVLFVLIWFNEPVLLSQEFDSKENCVHAGQSVDSQFYNSGPFGKRLDLVSTWCVQK